MLRSEHSIDEYHRGLAVPDRLWRKHHGHYIEYARRMLMVYQHGVGRTRRELHRAVKGVLANEPDCDRRRVAAFCKLLGDASVFAADRKGAAAGLRLRVFEIAAAHHPLVKTESRAKGSAGGA